MAKKPPKKEEKIFYRALEKSPEQREAFLKEACGKDQQLYDRVEALIKAHDIQDGFLESPILNSEVTLDDSPLSEAPGTKIGRYKLLEQIGEGGMAVVFMAEQTQPFQRRVALKIIKLGMDTRQVIARFEAERQALAMMDHPNIAKVHDAGTTETGRPYFVMELVRGISITEYCDKNNLNTQERLKLFIPVCQAIQHAHQKGIIHRDIKPSNVLVTMHDGTPMPKVIDFGIAKAINQRLTEKTLFTRFAQMIGTPEYMSPEQAEMSALDVDTRTDIYSLGVLLYELLIGITPFPAEELRSKGYAEIQRIIRETEPAKPSTKLSTLGDSLTDIAKHRKCSPVFLKKSVQGDLDWIVMKTLEKDRTRRYETAHGLVEDVERHLNYEPVHASPPSKIYRFKKFLHKNWRKVSVIAIIILIVLVGSLVSSLLIWREQQRTAKERDIALYNQYVSDMRLGPQLWEEGQVAVLKHTLERHIPQPGKEDLRSWEWYYLLSLCHQDKVTFHGHTSGLTSIAWNPNGRQVASISTKGQPKVWDARTGYEILTLADGNAEGSQIDWSPDGRFLATSSWYFSKPKEGKVQEAKIWDSKNGHKLTTLKHPTGVGYITWSPDGKYLATCGMNDVKIWDLSWEEVTTLTFTRPTKASRTGMVWSADSKKICVISNDRHMTIWDIDTGHELEYAKWSDEMYGVSWSPDGTRIATGSFWGGLRLWDSVNCVLVLEMQGSNAVSDVHWSPDGTKIVAATQRDNVQIWDANSGELLQTLKGHEGMMRVAKWSPDGKYIASGGQDGKVKIWDPSRYNKGVLIPVDEAMFFSWSPHSDKVAITYPKGIKIFHLDTETLEDSIYDGECGGISWAPTGNKLSVKKGKSTLVILDLENKLIHEIERIDKPVQGGMAWEQNGEKIAVRGDGGFTVYDSLTRKQKYHTDLDCWNLSWSPDGRYIAVGGQGGIISICDAANGKVIFELHGHPKGHYIEALCWSPDGRYLASSGWDPTMKVWDITTRKEISSTAGYLGGARPTTWTPDGKRVISVPGKVWDPFTGEEVMCLGGFKNVQLSPDGKKLLGRTLDGDLRLLDITKGYQIAGEFEQEPLSEEGGETK